MSNPKLVLRRGLLEGKTPVECIAALEAVCSAAAQCQEVQNSPLALQAFNHLQQAVGVAKTSFGNKEALALALMAAIKALDVDLGAAKEALGAYQSSMVVVAKGDASVFNKAGLLTRPVSSIPTPLGVVTGVTSKEGTVQREAILQWPPVDGATGYALQVNYAPQDPNAPWTTLTPGRGRRRTVKVPQPGAQFLARVAALGNVDQQSDWCAPILATAR